MRGRDVAEEVNGRRRVAPRAGHGEDADVEPHGSAGLRARGHLEVLDGIAPLHQRLHVAALIAEAIAGRVAADEDVTAGLSDDLPGHVAEEALGRSVPEHDPSVDADGADPVCRAGEETVKVDRGRLEIGTRYAHADISLGGLSGTPGS